VPHVTDHGLPPPVAPRFLPGGRAAILAGGEPDPYAWMRDRDLPAARDYLAAERAYYDRQLDTGLRNELAAELTARVLPAEESVRWRRGGRTYFTRTLPGREFEQFCRAGAGGDQVLLDINLLADDPGCAGGYVGLGVREVSPDGRLLAYSVDFDGDEVYQLRVRDLASGNDLAERIDGTYHELAWSADSRSVVEQRHGAAAQLRIVDRGAGAQRLIEAGGPERSLALATNEDYHAPAVTVCTQSLIDPPAWYDVDLASGRWEPRKRRDVPGYDPARYVTERIAPTTTPRRARGPICWSPEACTTRGY
jgi:protease II